MDLSTLQYHSLGFFERKIKESTDPLHAFLNNILNKVFNRIKKKKFKSDRSHAYLI